MQKKNSVIKNYILSSNVRTLDENPHITKTDINKRFSFTSEIFLYHLLSMQSKVFLYLFLLEILQKYHQKQTF